MSHQTLNVSTYHSPHATLCLLQARRLASYRVLSTVSLPSHAPTTSSTVEIIFCVPLSSCCIFGDLAGQALRHNYSGRAMTSFSMETQNDSSTSKPLQRRYVNFPGTGVGVIVRPGMEAGVELKFLLAVGVGSWRELGTRLSGWVAACRQKSAAKYV